MVKVIGYLKDDATKGEKRVLAALKNALPNDFYVYVECPLLHKGMERMPDFIVLTTFGVVVLEVKDWVHIVKADKFDVKVHPRKGSEYVTRNPVRQARQFAEILASMLQKESHLRNMKGKLKVPWGYAAVFPNLRSTILTQLRKPWGDAYVLSMADLKNHVITKRLRATLPFVCDLRREDLRQIRDAVNPSVSVTVAVMDDKSRDITLDEIQEEIVAESPHTVPTKPVKSKTEIVEAEQPTLLPAPKLEKDESPETEEMATPPEVEDLMRSFSIRLVRGVAGSGKTVVLMQRARYLAAQHPQWRIGVVTYNKRLADLLNANLKGIPNIKVTNFDKLCAALLRKARPWRSPSDSLGWLKNHIDQWPIVTELEAEFIAAEIKWIKEVGISERSVYLDVARKGREQGLRRRGRQREQIYDVLEAYNKWLLGEKTYDWADVPHLVVEALDENEIKPWFYDAVLIDEAQDFAPSWIRVIKRLLNPESGLIFLTDDPSQSIYRYYSWREKGIPVVGRTRWLRIPYRNTQEIYQAAYEVILDDELLKQQLEEQLGVTLSPDLNSAYLRRGPQPKLREFRSVNDECGFIKSEIEWLLQEGYDAREMVVLHRRRRGITKLERSLRGTGVEVSTFHALKGLEFDVVFLSQMQETFPKGVEQSEHALSEERRLVYMAMTRARERLYMGYEGQWPGPLEGVQQHTEFAFV